MNIIELLIQSFLIACFSYVYVIILFDQDMLLGFMYDPLDSLFRKTSFGRWVSKPLFKCVYCNSGQLSLWFYVIKYWNSYNLIENICFVSLTIFTVHVFIKKIGKI